MRCGGNIRWRSIVRAMRSSTLLGWHIGKEYTGAIRRFASCWSSMPRHAVIRRSVRNSRAVLPPGVTEEEARANIREPIELYLTPGEIDLPESARLIEVTVGWVLALAG